MLARTNRLIIAALSVATVTACSHASAERAAQLAADSARAEGAAPAEVTRRAERARRVVQAKDVATPKTANRTLDQGTALTLAAVTDISSQKNKVGDAFTARTTAAAVSAEGDTVIPVGAELVGRVSELASSPHRGAPGTLALEFNTLRFGGQDYPVSVRTTSMATHIVSRGLTVTDAAKVGVGAAAGAVAGRLLGHNTGSAAAGAVVGGTGGAVYANATRDYDIALSPGGSITVTLTSPFTREIAINR